MTQESKITSSSPISPPSEQIERAGSEKVDAPVALGQIRQADSIEHSHNVNHGSQSQQNQECTSLQSKFKYETGTFVVLTMGKEISDSN